MPALVCSCEPGSIELGCQACGASGTVSRELGDLRGRADRWMAAHRLPVILAVEVLTVDGASMGWWQCTSR